MCCKYRSGETTDFPGQKIGIEGRPYGYRRAFGNSPQHPQAHLMSLVPAHNLLSISRRTVRARTRLWLAKPASSIDGESMVIRIAGDFPGRYETAVRPARQGLITVGNQQGVCYEHYQ